MSLLAVNQIEVGLCECVLWWYRGRIPFDFNSKPCFDFKMVIIIKSAFISPQIHALNTDYNYRFDAGFIMEWLQL